MDYRGEVMPVLSCRELVRVARQRRRTSALCWPGCAAAPPSPLGPFSAPYRNMLCLQAAYTTSLSIPGCAKRSRRTTCWGAENESRIAMLTASVLGLSPWHCRGTLPHDQHRPRLRTVCSPLAYGL